MSFAEKAPVEEAEAMVDTLTIDGVTLSEAQLSAFSGCDLQQLAELSQELHYTNDTEEMEHQDVVTQDDVMEETVEEEVIVEPELGAQEIEVESEMDRAPSPEEILPDIKTAKPVVPPLRPLTIAPKPTKLPVQLKPVPGQQLLLLQSNTPGQTIKLLSPQGQELNLTNLTLGRPVTLKPAIKTLTTANNISVVQPKQVVMKKVITPVQKSVTGKQPLVPKPGQQLMVVQKTEPQLKLVQQPSSGLTGLPNPTKTITLQQAQELGLLTGAKLVPQSATSGGKHAVVLNKTQAKTIKIVPHQIKSPTKILPAPQSNTITKVPQRIILKSASSNQPVISASQIIQVPQPIASGQVHQINIPGKGVQYIKFVTASSAESLVTPSMSVMNAVKIQSPVQTVTAVSGASVKPTNVMLSELKPLPASTVLTQKTLKTIATVRPSALSAASTATPSSHQQQQQQQVVVVPTSFIPQPPQSSTSSVSVIPTAPAPKVPIPARPVAVPKPPPMVSPPSDPLQASSPADAGIESNGMRPRKPCNCTKSQCLKLYCDCFANGEFCHMCNCMNCFNNIDNEENRQRAIKNCLVRNPHAFRPKIGKAKDVSGDVAVRKHTKGCNCKRSGCLKNYCECYEAQIACSSNCKCIGCRNIEDSMDKKNVRPRLLPDSFVTCGTMPTAAKIAALPRDVAQLRPQRASTTKQAFNFMTNEVIEATSQCLLALTDNAEGNSQDEELIKKQIIEEFGRCLKEIIGCSLHYNK